MKYNRIANYAYLDSKKVKYEIFSDDKGVIFYEDDLGDIYAYNKMWDNVVVWQEEYDDWIHALDMITYYFKISNSTSIDIADNILSKESKDDKVNINNLIDTLTIDQFKTLPEDVRNIIICYVFRKGV